MTRPVDRNAERQDPQGLGPKDESDGALQAQAPNTPSHSNSTTIGERQAIAEAAINQNDAMRQELAHVGNLVSDLARRLGVDQANDDGTWPDLAGRIQKLIVATTTANAPVDDREAVIECCAKVAEEDWTPAYGQHNSKMEAVAEAQRTGIATRIRALRPKTTVPIHGDMREALEAAVVAEREACAKIAGRDVRSKGAIDCGYVPKFQERAWEIAKEIQARNALQGDGL